jgi:uncharacterized protein YifN (PemK superfamily)
MILLAITYHPGRGTVLCANFDRGFKVPEMVKRRLVVVMSPPIEARHGLCTIIPLSRSAPERVQPYHYRFRIPFQMPAKWGNDDRWAKCDMVCAVGFHRLDLVRLGKDRAGARRYQLNTLSDMHLRNISNCMLASFGLPPLTE